MEDNEDSSVKQNDVELLIDKIRYLLPDVEVRPWESAVSQEDKDLWFFSLPGIKKDVQVEGLSSPFLIETEEQSSANALKGRSIDETAALVVQYLTAAKLDKLIWLTGELYWPKM